MQVGYQKWAFFLPRKQCKRVVVVFNRDVPYIRFVFALVPNSARNIVFVF